MRQFLRSIFEFPYEKIGNGFLWAVAVLALIAFGGWIVLFLIVGIGGSFAIVNSVGYGWRRVYAYAYREPNPQWQGFLAT